jgi:hypothetical protein
MKFHTVVVYQSLKHINTIHVNVNTFVVARLGRDPCGPHGLLQLQDLLRREGERKEKEAARGIGSSSSCKRGEGRRSTVFAGN